MKRRARAKGLAKMEPIAGGEADEKLAALLREWKSHLAAHAVVPIERHPTDRDTGLRT